MNSPLFSKTFSYSSRSISVLQRKTNCYHLKPPFSIKFFPTHWISIIISCSNLVPMVISTLLNISSNFFPNSIRILSICTRPIRSTQLYTSLVNIIRWYKIRIEKSTRKRLPFFFAKNIARYCLDHGAQVDSINKDGNTPLFIAAEKLATPCAKVRSSTSVQIWSNEFDLA